MGLDSKLKRYKTYDNLNDLNKLREEFRKKLNKVPPTMEYMRNLILDAKLLFRIVTDPNFDLGEEAREDFLAALWYFIDSKDSIPDWIPVVGYWDDYRVIRYVKEKHREEIERYFSETKFFIANYF
ncbi:MAG: YkvA family protein [Aquificota bacterium]|nr:YkvA family protein [Aquificota bacterium]MDQ7081630.1 YkvA family protein [Aquificota bacterium]